MMRMDGDDEGNGVCAHTALSLTFSVSHLEDAVDHGV